jgi:hypothetical protein
MALIGSAVLVEVRPETEYRWYRLGFSWVRQSRTNTTRVYECDADSAADTIADPGGVGTVQNRSNVRKDVGNRYRRVQLVMLSEGTWA